MKWAKSIIGEIGVIETRTLPYKGAIKKIPKNAREMEGYEVMNLRDNDRKSLKNIPAGWYYAHGNDKYYRACRLDFFDEDSVFVAYGRVVGFHGALRGVLVVKR